MSFVVKKRIELNHLGEGWEDAYLIFSPFTFDDNVNLIALQKKLRDVAANNTDADDAQTASKEMMKILKEKLVEGKGFDGDKLIDVTKENFHEMPMEVIVDVIYRLQGEQLEKKISTPSGN